MKILIVGKSGFIGSHIYKKLLNKHDIDIPSSKELDITDKQSIKNYLFNKKYDYIIFAAACKDIKKLEQNPETASKINTEPIKHFTEFMTGGKLLFLSTDYVFNGEKGLYKDIDKTDANTIYGKTKQQAEKYLLTGNTDFTIIRTAAVLGKGSVFFEWLLSSLKNKTELEMYEDSYFTPTPAAFLCDITEKIIENGCNEKIIHAVGEKRLSRLELAEIVKNKIHSGCKIIPVKNGFRDFSLIQSESVKNIQKKNFEYYLDEEIKQCID